jgi:hypothetical protein
MDTSLARAAHRLRSRLDRRQRQEALGELSGLYSDLARVLTWLRFFGGVVAVATLALGRSIRLAGSFALPTLGVMLLSGSLVLAYAAWLKYRAAVFPSPAFGVVRRHDRPRLFLALLAGELMLASLIACAGAYAWYVQLTRANLV